MPSEKPNRGSLRLALLYLPLMLDRRARPGRCRVNPIERVARQQLNYALTMAEVDILRLRAELAEEHREFVAAEDKVISACGRARQAEAALARVRELLDGIVDRMGSYDHYVPPTAEDIFAIRAAIEGEHQ